MNMNQLEKPLGIALILAVLGLAAFILKPFFLALIWGGLIAFATWPLHAWLTGHIKSKTASATLLSLVLAALFIVPLIGVGLSIAGDGKALLAQFLAQTKTDLPDAPTWLVNVPVAGAAISEYWTSWQAKGVDWFADAVPYVQQATKFIFMHWGALGYVAIQIALAILFTFWFYLQGQSIAASLKQVLGRIVGDAHARYWQVASDTIQNVINGIMGTAFAQGVVAAIGFLIAGVPYAFLLGGLTFLLSFIPMTPPLVWIPATIWLVLQEQYGYAVFMGLWGLFFISGVDNLVRPLLICRGSMLPLEIVLVGVIGGVLAFGFLGLFVGPVVLALSYTMVKEWMSQQRTTEP